MCENLKLVGTALVGKGNALANMITGNDAANRLKGAGGPDTLLGEDIFAAIGGKLGKREFEIGPNIKADDGNDYLIFNETSGKLSYDANGDDAGGKGVFARLGKDVSLSHKDFAMIEDLAV